MNRRSPFYSLVVIIMLVVSACRTPGKKEATPVNEEVLNSDTALTYISRLFMANRTEEAIALLEKGVKKMPGNPEYGRRLSEAYIHMGREKDALDQIEALLAKDSLDFETWYNKGMLLAEMQDTAAAIHALERSFSLQPLQTSGVALANLYAETKNPQTLLLTDAMLKKDTARELIDPVFIKGIYYSNIHNDKEALRQFDECIKRDWKFTEAYIEKGIIYYNKQHFREALASFQMAATVTNTYPDAYYWLGRTHEAMGQKKEASLNYYRALALDKNFEEAREGMKRTNTP